MNDEQLFKASFDELSIVMLDAMKNNAMLKAQAEFYINKYNELLEEHNKLIEEKEQLRKEYNSLLEKNDELKEDLRKLESQPDI
jgi:hypothetical protein